jgi:hypothetical protein
MTKLISFADESGMSVDNFFILYNTTKNNLSKLLKNSIPTYQRQILTSDFIVYNKQQSVNPGCAFFNLDYDARIVYLPTFPNFNSDIHHVDLFIEGHLIQKNLYKIANTNNGMCVIIDETAVKNKGRSFNDGFITLTKIWKIDDFTEGYRFFTINSESKQEIRFKNFGKRPFSYDDFSVFKIINNKFKKIFNYSLKFNNEDYSSIEFSYHGINSNDEYLIVCHAYKFDVEISTLRANHPIPLVNQHGIPLPVSSSLDLFVYDDNGVLLNTYDYDIDYENMLLTIKKSTKSVRLIHYGTIKSINKSYSKIEFSYNKENFKQNSFSFRNTYISRDITKDSIEYNGLFLIDSFLPLGSNNIILYINGLRVPSSYVTISKRREFYNELFLMLDSVHIPSNSVESVDIIFLMPEKYDSLSDDDLFNSNYTIYWEMMKCLKSEHGFEKPLPPNNIYGLIPNHPISPYSIGDLWPVVNTENLMSDLFELVCKEEYSKLIENINYSSLKESCLVTQDLFYYPVFPFTNIPLVSPGLLNKSLLQDVIDDINEHLLGLEESEKSEWELKAPPVNKFSFNGSKFVNHKVVGLDSYYTKPFTSILNLLEVYSYGVIPTSEYEEYLKSTNFTEYVNSKDFQNWYNSSLCTYVRTLESYNTYILSIMAIIDPKIYDGIINYFKKMEEYFLQLYRYFNDNIYKASPTYTSPENYENLTSNTATDGIIKVYTTLKTEFDKYINYKEDQLVLPLEEVSKSYKPFKISSKSSIPLSFIVDNNLRRGFNKNYRDITNKRIQPGSYNITESEVNFILKTKRSLNLFSERIIDISQLAEFDFSKMNAINLSYNNIREIPDKLLENLLNIVTSKNKSKFTLDLKGNKSLSKSSISKIVKFIRLGLDIKIDKKYYSIIPDYMLLNKLNKLFNYPKNNIFTPIAEGLVSPMKELDLSNSKLLLIDGLEQFSGIKKLNLQNNYIQNITKNWEIIGRSLEELNLRNNFSLSDNNFLFDLKRLKVLDISNTKIENINFSKISNKLIKLNASCSSLIFAGIKDLKLSYIDFSRCTIDEYSDDYSKLHPGNHKIISKNLEYLDISGTTMFEGKGIIIDFDSSNNKNTYLNISDTGISKVLLSFSKTTILNKMVARNLSLPFTESEYTESGKIFLTEILNSLTRRIISIDITGSIFSSDMASTIVVDLYQMYLNDLENNLPITRITKELFFNDIQTYNKIIISFSNVVLSNVFNNLERLELGNSKIVLTTTTIKDEPFLKNLKYLNFNKNSAQFQSEDIIKTFSNLYNREKIEYLGLSNIELSSNDFIKLANNLVNIANKSTIIDLTNNTIPKEAQLILFELKRNGWNINADFEKMLIIKKRTKIIKGKNIV